MFEIENNAITNFERGHAYPVVRVPDGVEEIKPFALADLACTALVLPPSLKRIGHDAFSEASIYNIDFGTGVKEIGSCAFKRCFARATLPESLESIGAFGVNELSISVENRVKLPKSLRYLGNSAIGLRNVTDIDVDESMVTERSNLANALVSALWQGLFVNVHVFREEEELYSFILARDFPTDRKNDTYTWRACSLVIREDGLSYPDYDEAFRDMNNKRCKLKMAVMRLSNPVSMEKDAKAAYDKYVHDNYRDLVPYDDDINSLRRYGEIGLFTQYRLKSFLESARQNQNLEAIAYLTDLLNRQYGTKGKSLKL
jgi:hypothetical protein